MASLTFQNACSTRHMLSSPCALRACLVPSLTLWSWGHRVVRSSKLQKVEGLAFHETDLDAGGSAWPVRPAGAGWASSFHGPCRRLQRRGLRGAGRLMLSEGGPDMWPGGLACPCLLCAPTWFLIDLNVMKAPLACPCLICAPASLEIVDLNDSEFSESSSSWPS